jgi:Rps23 Pro-64 3,4-dihydroxylase Tpa1-like proline 4-hydroxylase
MKLSDVINDRYLNPNFFTKSYNSASPFPHIVMKNFIKENILNKVVDEFPDLAKFKNQVKKFNNENEIKLNSQGMQILSPNALHLNSYLNSDLMLSWLNSLTGIKETLISDPYLTGGGYHEIKKGGLLKVHADFNKHPKLDLDRRLNMIIYLNKNWQEQWGGALELFDKKINSIKKIYPMFNTAIIFSTTSFTFHGHPEPLICPEDQSRKSFAYYYYSTGRPNNEIVAENHGTLFVERLSKNFTKKLFLKNVIKKFIPPIIVDIINKLKNYI